MELVFLVRINEFLLSLLLVTCDKAIFLKYAKINYNLLFVVCKILKARWQVKENCTINWKLPSTEYSIENLVRKMYIECHCQ